MVWTIETLTKSISIVCDPDPKEIILYSYNDNTKFVKEEIEAKHVYKLTTIFNWFVKNSTKAQTLSSKVSDKITAIVEVPKFIWLKHEPSNTFALIPTNEIECLRLQLNCYVSCLPLLVLGIPVRNSISTVSTINQDIPNVVPPTPSCEDAVTSTCEEVADDANIEKLSELLNMVMLVDADKITDENKTQLQNILKECGLNVDVSTETLITLLRTHQDNVRQQFLSKDSNIDFDMLEKTYSDNPISLKLVQKAKVCNDKGQSLRYLVAAYLFAQLKQTLDISASLQI